jgi:group I intron endonuclease
MVIYKTINLINGRYYIGKDAKDDKNYLGSGIALKSAIKKYGKENFEKHILHHCDTLEELNILEKEYVNESVISDPMSYNIALGGQGGDLSKFVKKSRKGKTYDELYGEELAKELRHKRSESSKGEKNGMYGKHLTAGEKNGMYGKKGSLCPNHGIVRSPEVRLNMRNAQLGKKASEDTKKLMRSSASTKKLNYSIHQINSEGVKINEFRTFKEAVKILNISLKRLKSNKYDFTLIKVSKNGIV